MSSTNKHAGFTLIELIVVIAIMTLFFGISIANYNGFTAEKKFDAEVKKFVDILELAKSKARAGDIGGFSCEDFDGYEVAFADPNYFLRMCCDNVCTSFNTISTYAFPDGVTATLTGATEIRFHPLSFALDSPNPITITINSGTLNKCVEVMISTNGLIEEGAKYAC
ncbi:MAG: hypothetical protein RI947_559 [Candidatus Parcubacteria bacterium]|jgi:prepilin-type N-terminal cleavage/methylation domain-containing protein